MQIKTMLTHFTSTTTATIKEIIKKCCRGRGTTGTLIHRWWECKMVQLLWKTAWEFLKRIIIELSCEPKLDS